MTERELVEGHCPACGTKRAEVIKEHHPLGRGGTYYQILACRGCGEFYFKSKVETFDVNSLFSGGNTKYWPPPAKRYRPEWVGEIFPKDQVLGRLFDDVHTALSNDLGVLAAIGMRTVFDCASELLKIDPSKNFEEKLSALKERGHITEKEKKVLGVLIDAGSAAAHRGWRPKPKQLDDMMAILEAFLHRAFVLEDVSAELSKNIPPRPSKDAKKKPA